MKQYISVCGKVGHNGKLTVVSLLYIEIFHHQTKLQQKIQHCLNIVETFSYHRRNIKNKHQKNRKIVKLYIFQTNATSFYLQLKPFSNTCETSRYILLNHKKKIKKYTYLDLASSSSSVTKSLASPSEPTTQQ